MIELRDLEFHWPGTAAACLDVALLQMSQGESALLRGASGSGKSTLLALLGGVVVPGRGSVQVLGADFVSLSARARDRFRADHIGFLFQQFNLIPYLSVVENVLLPCGFSTRRRDAAAAQGMSARGEAKRLLSRLDVDSSLWSRGVTRLSVGQQQRVAIARAMIGRPELIIADEPTSALDEARKESFLDLLMQECAAAGSTLLFASHDAGLEKRFDRIIDLPALNRARAPAAACAS